MLSDRFDCFGEKMLVRLGSQEFAELVEEWSKQCALYGDSFENYSTPTIELFRSISNEDPSRPSSGVFKLDYGDGPVAMAHVNCARLPRTDGKTLRIHWLVLAPRFDYEEVLAEDLATITTKLIIGAVEEAHSQEAKQIKIHLGNSIERTYFSAIAVALATQGVFNDPQVRGQWLELGL